MILVNDFYVGKMHHYGFTETVIHDGNGTEDGTVRKMEREPKIERERKTEREPKIERERKMERERKKEREWERKLERKRERSVTER